MKKSGVVSKSMLALSINQISLPQKPYAMFGTYNASQIVGGSAGLHTVKNMKNILRTWAMTGENAYYDSKPLFKKDHASIPAIIDSGTS